MVDNVIYIDGERAVKPVDLTQTYDDLRRCPDSGRSFCWIGLLRPSEDEIRSVAKEFNLHSLAVEDAIDAHQRPKLERYGGVWFLVLRPARYVDKTEDVELGEIHLFLGEDFVVGIRHAEEPDLHEVRTRLEGDRELLKKGPNAVMYAVLDKVVDDYTPVLDGLQNDIDQIEVQVFDGDPYVSRRIYQLSREVIEFQRAIEPLREVLVMIRELLKERANTGDLELRRMLRDVADHVTKAHERVASYRELLNNILAVNSTLVAQRQNEEMTRLTEASLLQGEQTKRISSWAAILFTPTLIAGIYGMNFQHMPELGWLMGYPMAIGLMVVLGIGLWLIFRVRGWL
ncbi:MAG TPA: magnesium and cobalt transport protein CorA [Pseudonocardia sp.]|jgi:magnesium transporter|nr:magnesium and cobalt transport protein CorA [Pseudonocardia sp.]